MPWKTRKRGTNRQRGQPFYKKTYPRIEARKRAIDREKYLTLRESKTHDINSVMAELSHYSRMLNRILRQAEKEGFVAENKLELLNGVLEVLVQIRSSGRTRVGDAELKSIVRSVAQQLKISPTVLREQTSAEE